VGEKKRGQKTRDLGGGLYLGGQQFRRVCNGHLKRKKRNITKTSKEGSPLGPGVRPSRVFPSEMICSPPEKRRKKQTKRGKGKNTREKKKVPNVFHPLRQNKTTKNKITKGGKKLSKDKSSKGQAGKSKEKNKKKPKKKKHHRPE